MHFSTAVSGSILFNQMLLAMFIDVIIYLFNCNSGDLTSTSTLIKVTAGICQYFYLGKGH